MQPTDQLQPVKLLHPGLWATGGWEAWLAVSVTYQKIWGHDGHDPQQQVDE